MGINQGGIYALMMAEIYGNIITGMTTGVNRWNYQRGGKLLMFNNIGSSSSGTPDITINDDINDSVSAVDNPAISIQHPNDDYIFNNTWNGTRINATEGDDCCSSIAENSEFYNYNASCTGSSCTSGIGIGATAPTGTCTKGVGYWVTSKANPSEPPATMADMKTYTQGGVFYKCTAQNTWTEYYTPYPYPHPFRVPGAPPKAPMLFVVSTTTTVP